MEMISLERTCRYGHGPLVEIATLEGRPVSFGYVIYYKDDGAHRLMHGFRLFVCQHCGYTELQDADVSMTLQHAKGEHP
jgi:hypothetical protein